MTKLVGGIYNVYPEDYKIIIDASEDFKELNKSVRMLCADLAEKYDKLTSEQYQKLLIRNFLVLGWDENRIKQQFIDIAWEIEV